MGGEAIFAPLCAFTLWLALLWGLLGYVRISRAVRGQIPGEYLRVGTGPPPDESIVTVHHHWSNEFEVPLLFYLACLALFAAGAVDAWAVGLAWAFVALRLIHSACVLTRNVPQVRVVPFFLSSLAVWGLWALLFVRVVA